MNTGNELEVREDSASEQSAGYAPERHPVGEGSGGDRGGGGSSGGDEAGDSPVNYEESALLEIELDGTDYRLDVGRAGTALCISTRPNGSWSWIFRGEARWQANVLRCKAFDRSVLTRLSRALAEAAADSQS